MELEAEGIANRQAGLSGLFSRFGGRKIMAASMTRIGNALAIFLRYPEAGKVKSRLAAKLGWSEAARIYEILVRNTLGVAADYKKLRPRTEIFLFFTPTCKQKELESAFPGPWEFIAQQGAHLGLRMDRAIQQVLSAGYRQVVLIGSDIADLRCSDLEDAFQAIERGCAVLNPAADGGFYLIGVDRPCPAALAPEQWGTSDVFRRTRDLLVQLGFSLVVQHQRADIDRPEDAYNLHGHALLQDRISVIIPTRKSVDQLFPLLNALDAQLWPDDEIIISRHQEKCSAHCEQNLSPRMRLLDSPLGRGVQLDNGVKEARGNLFWFLHDDSIPPDQFGYFVRKISHKPQYSLGCFLLDYYPSNRSMELIARWANFRSRRLGLPYGDQGLFCRSEIFWKLGGFRQRYLMEDVDFVRRAKRLGRLLIINERLSTSSKRYFAKGILRASMRNHLTMLLYLMGVDEAQLVSFYYR